MPSKLVVTILLLIVLTSKGSILDSIFHREAAVIQKKIGNYTAVDKMFASTIFVFFWKINFQLKIGFFASIGVQKLSEDNFALFGPVFVYKNLEFCSNVPLTINNTQFDIENPAFCENNYCTNYTLSSLPLVWQTRLFFVTDILLTNSIVTFAVLDTTNHFSLKKLEMEAVRSLMNSINHGWNVENSWNLKILFLFSTFPFHSVTHFLND
jgi:hypothetical protein